MPDSTPAARPEPLQLMTAALLAAAEDCDGAQPGGRAPAGRTLMARADSIRVVASLGWSTTNPALLVAERLGFVEGEEPAELMVSSIGGNNPQALMHQACLAISRGELDVVLVTGAEAMYARALARRDPGRPWLEWASQPQGTPPATLFGVEKAGATDLELQRGVALPVHAYPLFENALRAAKGWTLQEHRARIGALWSRFSEVAAGNPHAWIRTARTPDEIVTPTPNNRMVSFPYPKLCTANMQVDQGAAYIVCSVAAARAAGVPEERWVFPLAGADGNDHWFISERPELHRSPAIRLAGGAALEQAGLHVDEVAFIDLYSCFPAVVEMAAGELGLALDDPDRPLTLTGGLTFGGGPGNNYATHGIASAVAALRARAGHRRPRQRPWLVRLEALLRGVRLAAAGPRRHPTVRVADVQPAVDALPRCSVDPEATGAVRVETYTVTFDRDGAPERGHPRVPHPGGHPSLGQYHRRGFARPPVCRGGHRPDRRPCPRRPAHTDRVVTVTDPVASERAPGERIVQRMAPDERTSVCRVCASSSPSTASSNRSPAGGT